MKNRLIIFQVLLYAIFLMIGFLSCMGDVPDLSQYRGIDYIKNYKFRSVASWIDEEKWSLNLQKIVDPVSNHKYMGFNKNEDETDSNLAGVDKTGLPPEAEEDISRIEVFNLVKDGGFELSTLPLVPAGWSAVGEQL